MELVFNINNLTERAAMGETFQDGKRESNTGIVIFDDFLLAIDPTTNFQTASEYRKKIEEEFNLPVKYLFITHHDGDHTFGALAFKDSIVIGHQNLTNRLQRKIKDEWLQIKNEIVFPQITFKEKMVINVNDIEVEFHHAGGHSDCSSYVYFPKEKVLFAGDLMFSRMFPWAGDSTASPDQWINILQQFLDMDIKFLVPGHGPLCGKNEVRKHLNHFEELRAIVLDAIMDGTDISSINRPEFYPASSEIIISKTLEYYYQYYTHRKCVAEVKIW
ncbi:MAG: MBL fold metallo-hydrolase [Candidatus Thorarchaeota archaeon]